MPVPVHFLTWTTYGTWLPGDERGWASCKTHEPMAPQPRLERYCATRLRAPPVFLDARQRAAGAAAFEEACGYYGWALFAVNIRTAHGHALVGAEVPGSRVLQALKARATRRLREQGLVAPERPVWASGGSTRIVRDSQDGRAALAYVLEGQGEDSVPGAIRGRLATQRHPGTHVPGSSTAALRTAPPSPNPLPHGG
jgi:hypothetical protein